MNAKLGKYSTVTRLLFSTLSVQILTFHEKRMYSPNGSSAMAPVYLFGGSVVDSQKYPDSNRQYR